MREFIFGLFPGSILIYRYSSGIISWTTLSLLIMEIAPYVIIALLESIRLDLVFFGFFILYGIYEFGYLSNDKIAINEKNGATLRPYITKFNLKIFAIGRLFALGILYIYAINTDIVMSNGLAMLLLVIPVFYFHNSSFKGAFRILTFILLNQIKILVRLLILSPSAFIYLLAAGPHIFIKLLHYLDAKKLIIIKKDEFVNISLFVYIAFIMVLVIIDYRIAIASFPYFINHNKSFVLAWLKKNVQR